MFHQFFLATNDTFPDDASCRYNLAYNMLHCLKIDWGTGISQLSICSCFRFFLWELTFFSISFYLIRTCPCDELEFWIRSSQSDRNYKSLHPNIKLSSNNVLEFCTPIFPMAALYYMASMQSVNYYTGKQKCRFVVTQLVIHYLSISISIFQALKFLLKLLSSDDLPVSILIPA